MFVILVPIAFILLSLLLYRELEPRLELMTGAVTILFSALFVGLWIAVSIEILSIFRALTQTAVVVGWLLLTGGIFTLLLIGRRIRWPHWSVTSLSARQKLMGAPVLLIVLISGLNGLLSAPNNWDSMTYHLSRVMHWLQNQSVAHYATHEVRQLYQAPWSEFFIAHLYLLTNSDRLVNMVQWLSMVGSIVGVGVLVRLLGGSKNCQIFAGLIAATIPIGILQAVSTQTDYVVTFWLVCFVIFSLLAMKRPNGWYVFAMSASLGLAVFSKATAYIYAAPFFGWFGVYFFRHYRWHIWKPIIVVGLLILAVNFGHYFRNFQLFGHPLQPDLGKFNYVNQLLTPAGFISNLSRNVALHANVPLPWLGNGIEAGVTHLHQMLQLSIDDSRTSYAGIPFKVDPFTVNEDTSGNFIHAILLFCSLIILVMQSLRRKIDDVTIYAGMLLLAGLLFVTYLKWQPWHSRLHLPLFVLGAPVVSLMLTRVSKRVVVPLVATILAAQTIPFLFYNPNHPLGGDSNIFTLTRTEEYFLMRPTLMEPYKIAAQQIAESDCDRVGLVMPGDSWEYPFWVLLPQTESRTIKLKSIEPDQHTRPLLDDDFAPCAVICLGCQAGQFVRYLEEFGPPRLELGSNFLFSK